MSLSLTVSICLQYMYTSQKNMRGTLGGGDLRVTESEVNVGGDENISWKKRLEKSKKQNKNCTEWDRTCSVGYQSDAKHFPHKQWISHQTSNASASVPTEDMPQHININSPAHPGFVLGVKPVTTVWKGKPGTCSSLVCCILSAVTHPQTWTSAHLNWSSESYSLVSIVHIS